MKTRKSILTIITLLIVAFISLSVSIPHRHNNQRVIEERVVIENWMTKPFVDSFEEPLEIEDWMLVPFNIN